MIDDREFHDFVREITSIQAFLDTKAESINPFVGELVDQMQDLMQSYITKLSEVA